MLSETCQGRDEQPWARTHMLDAIAFSPLQSTTVMVVHAQRMERWQLFPLLQSSPSALVVQLNHIIFHPLNSGFRLRC